MAKITGTARPDIPEKLVVIVAYSAISLFVCACTSDTTQQPTPDVKNDATVKKDVAKDAATGDRGADLTGDLRTFTGTVKYVKYDGSASCLVLNGDDGKTYGLHDMPAPDGTHGPLGSWSGWHVSVTGRIESGPPPAPCAQVWIQVVTVTQWTMA